MAENAVRLHGENPIEYDVKDNCISEMLENIKNLIGDEELSDCILISTDDKKFYVNKAILSARSSFFRSLLKSLESQGTITCCNLSYSSDILEQVLNFIYTGALKDIEKSTSYDLLSAVDKYALPGIKQLCESHSSKKPRRE